MVLFEPSSVVKLFAAVSAVEVAEIVSVAVVPSVSSSFGIVGGFLLDTAADLYAAVAAVFSCSTKQFKRGGINEGNEEKTCA